MSVKSINTIMHKELRGYFNSPLAYIFITVFLVLTSWLFFRSFFLNNQASMRAYFALLPWFFIIFIPAITMRLWAEEQKAGTIETLLTSPITEWDAVIGKFLASFWWLPYFVPVLSPPFCFMWAVPMRAPFWVGIWEPSFWEPLTFLLGFGFRVLPTTKSSLLSFR